MDELRRERKILMVLDDLDVDKYVACDMTEVDMADLESHEELEPLLKKFVKEKLEFRQEFSLRTSTTRLDYIYRMLREIFGKAATIEDPERFLTKVRRIERQEKRLQERLERQGSSLSMFSLYSKSQKTGVSFDSASETSKGMGENAEGKDAGADNLDGMTTTTAAAMRNPVLLEIQEFFETMDSGVTVAAEQRLAVLEKQGNQMVKQRT